MFQNHTPRLSYFTDLAELVSKIEEPPTSESMDQDDYLGLSGMQAFFSLYKYYFIIITINIWWFSKKMLF